MYGGLAVDESLKVDRLAMIPLASDVLCRPWLWELLQLQSDQHVNALALVGMFDVVAFLEVSIPIWENHPGS